MRNGAGKSFEIRNQIGEDREGKKKKRTTKILSGVLVCGKEREKERS